VKKAIAKIFRENRVNRGERHLEKKAAHPRGVHRLANKRKVASRSKREIREEGTTTRNLERRLRRLAGEAAAGSRGGGPMKFANAGTLHKKTDIGKLLEGGCANWKIRKKKHCL